MTPTPADEALAREICDKTAFTLGSSWKGEDMGKAWREAAQLIAAHVAAQAPSGCEALLHRIYGACCSDTVNGRQVPKDTYDEIQRAVNEVAAHKAQPVADVRGMVEEDMRNLLRKRLETTTQRVLAVELGVSCQYVNDIVHGRRGISDEVAATMGYSRQLKYTPLASARHAMGGEVK